MDQQILSITSKEKGLLRDELTELLEVRTFTVDVIPAHEFIS